MMAGRKVANQTIVVRPTHVVTRQSTDVVAVADPAVSAALRFIHQHAENEPIQVTDVLSAISVSRRTLYERFSKVLGRSVHEEIKRVRVDQFAKLLVSTNLTESQIAATMGWSDTKNIARYFRKQMGMSPSEYRKSHSLP
jgi:LacI family transcriptional regulator